MKRIKSYSELMSFETFDERLQYLMCNNFVGKETFGSHRYLNQRLYSSEQWKRVRREVLVRDGGFDLAHEDYPIYGSIYIHHINPITIDDILEQDPEVFNPRNLISTSFQTHNQIHYGNEKTTIPVVLERKPGDTCLWR